jgi:hypothetical protein
MRTRRLDTASSCRSHPSPVPARAGGAGGLLALQRAVGNRAVTELLAVQRVIVRPAEVTDTDRPAEIHNELETEETVGALTQATGQTVDVYGGTVAVDHGPAENYLIGHGAAGQAFDWKADAMAAELVTRGITPGDCVSGVCVGRCRVHRVRVADRWTLSGAAALGRYSHAVSRSRVGWFVAKVTLWSEVAAMWFRIGSGACN